MSRGISGHLTERPRAHSAQKCTNTSSMDSLHPSCFRCTFRLRRKLKVYAQMPSLTVFSTCPSSYHPIGEYDVASRLHLQKIEVMFARTKHFKSVCRIAVLHWSSLRQSTSVSLRVCCLFLDAHEQLDPSTNRSERLYNSKGMTRNCSTSVVQQGTRAGFVDLGIAESDSHTEFSKDPTTTAMNAFIDYMSLMDASIIVRTGSSFSGTVAGLKGMECQDAQSYASGCPSLKICTPRGC